MIIGAAVLGLGLVSAALTRVGGPDDSDTAGSIARSPSPTGSAADGAAARRLASRVALTPADWGPGFIRSTRYETAPVAESVVLLTCEWSSRAVRAGTVASVSRSVHEVASGLSATSEVRVFDDEDTAQTYVTDVRDGIRRCPAQHRDRERWVDVRTTPSPQVPGFDEIVAEEGRQVAAEDGTRTDRVYVLLTARADATVLTASAGGQTDALRKIREQAADGLRKMQKRLAQGPGAIAMRPARPSPSGRGQGPLPGDGGVNPGASRPR
ncbi:hypothetical protein OHS70_10680 [Streptomyces sp. NBC_00390]|uniref:hypothetical protein n=1 Tax=Streptomyces sp. NBC_00390 TaxID=2975736 RepID=UPI002E1B5168